MIDPRVARLARLPLAAFATALTLGIATVVGSHYFLGEAQRTLGNARAQHGALQEILDTHRADLDFITRHRSDHDRLHADGLLGNPARPFWVDRLIASRQRLGLPETLGYALKPPAPAQPEAPSPFAAEVQAGDGSGPLAHDLEFTLSTIHEGELLHLIADYRSNAGGRFRVQSCRLAEASPAGLTAACTLRFFTLPKPPATGDEAGA